MLEKDGVLYGRGVSDNKSGVLAGLYILRALRDLEIPFCVVATKVDKLNATERKKNLEAISNHPLIVGHEVIPFSALKNEGKEELWKTIFRYIKV